MHIACSELHTQLVAVLEKCVANVPWQPASPFQRYFASQPSHFSPITAEESHGRREEVRNREERLQAGQSLAAERNLQEGSLEGNPQEVLLCLGSLGRQHQPPGPAIRCLRLFLPVC